MEYVYYYQDVTMSQCHEVAEGNTKALRATSATFLIYYLRFSYSFMCNTLCQIMSVFGRQNDREQGTGSSHLTTPDSGYVTMSPDSRKRVSNTPLNWRRERPAQPTYKRSYASPAQLTSEEQREYSDLKSHMQNLASQSNGQKRIAARKRQEWLGRSLISIQRLFQRAKGPEQTSKKLQRRRRRERRWPASLANGRRPTSNFTEVGVISVFSEAWPANIWQVPYARSASLRSLRSDTRGNWGLRVRVWHKDLCLGINELSGLLSPARSWKSDVWWLFGPPGVGKSRLARDASAAYGTGDGYTGTTYSKSGGNKWFDGYDGQSVVIWDEPTGELEWGALLQLSDRYEYRVEVKGGMKQFLARLIIFTSNFHPETLFNKYQNCDAFLRRITLLLECTDKIYET